MIYLKLKINNSYKTVRPRQKWTPKQKNQVYQRSLELLLVNQQWINGCRNDSSQELPVYTKICKNNKGR